MPICSAQELKHVVIVDDDIIFFDPNESIRNSTRVKGDEDIYIYPNVRGIILIRALIMHRTKVGIDATMDMSKSEFERVKKPKVIYVI